MNHISIAVIAGGFLLFSLISGRLQGTVVTAPLVFILFGFLIGDGGLAIASVDSGHAAIHLIAELTLILVLFTDAARIDLSRLRRDHNLPVRMLMIGLPLVVVAGALAAVQLFPAFTFWEAVLLAALLARPMRRWASRWCPQKSYPCVYGRPLMLRAVLMTVLPYLPCCFSLHLRVHSKKCWVLEIGCVSACCKSRWGHLWVW